MEEQKINYVIFSHASLCVQCEPQILFKGEFEDKRVVHHITFMFHRQTYKANMTSQCEWILLQCCIGFAH